ncbi:MAG: FIST C-terminal domain-containing protein [Bacteroidetes bacterium]|nr:FIST C-terminal domain-containing protein [Bacteroidota bacterium]
MKSQFFEKNLTEGLAGQLARWEADPEVQSVLILMAEKDRPSDRELNAIFKKAGKPLLGGVFPEIISDGHRKETGVLLLGLPFPVQVTVLPMNTSMGDLLGQLDGVFADTIITQKSVFIFYDSMGKQKTDLIESLYNYFGNGCTYFGGGAGSLSFTSIQCIISPAGMMSDAAVIGLADQRLSIGVAHGWEPVSDPMKVTKASGNVVHQINRKPAFEEYQSVIRTHSGQEITPEDFFNIAKSYPLGIAKLDSEMIVRDPFATDGSSISILDDILEGEYIQILHGNKQTLLAGASAASQKAGILSSASQNSRPVLCIDCISRVLYLQSDFDQELSRIGPSGQLMGALTLGEVANSGDSFLEIYNKTVVVGRF